MAKPEILYSSVVIVPRDEHMDIRVEVKARKDADKRSGTLIIGKVRDGERVIDIYCSKMSPKQMMDISNALREAAQTVASRGA